MQTIPQRLAALRAKMRAAGAQACLIGSADFHGSEYVGEHFRCREYFSGFDGSAGTLLVTERDARLWTDGRYYLQAQAQLSGTGIELMRGAQADVPTPEEFLAAVLPAGSSLVFDGRTVSKRDYDVLEKALTPRGIRLCGARDIAGAAYAQRPPLTFAPVFPVDIPGNESAAHKLARLRKQMREAGADVFFTGALDEIAWLTNLRGSDIACTPVFLSFMLVEKSRATLFAGTDALNKQAKAALREADIVLADYAHIYDALRALPPAQSVLCDPLTTNSHAYACIGVPMCTPSPLRQMKARKSEAEIACIRDVHLRDGAAVWTFLCRLRARVGSGAITEREAADLLEECRREQPGYLGPSFEPIIAYGAHGAIVHYKATEKTDVRMQACGFCLIDTGGQYRFGTTDVTRTVALGALSEEEKRAYTLVLRGHLALAEARFAPGEAAGELDALARRPLMQVGWNYAHGTGHGVGFLLCVHESPPRIGTTRVGDTDSGLYCGMVVSNEPGVYFSEKFGVRLENLELVCTTHDKTALYFEPLTMVPFDRRAIVAGMLSAQELAALNAYHTRVRAALSSRLKPEEKGLLIQATEPILA